MGQQIKRSGSAVPTVRLVEDLEERVVNGAEKLLAQSTAASCAYRMDAASGPVRRPHNGNLPIVNAPIV